MRFIEVPAWSGVVVALLACAACAQVDAPPDYTMDTASEPAPDTPIDETVDSLPDVPAEPEPDVPVDSPLDVPVDTGLDTAVDPPLDTIVDPPLDTIVDPPLDTAVDTATDTAVDTATDTGGGWGTPVCGAGGMVSELSDWSDTVVIPDLGTVRVMQLEIDIPDRQCSPMGITTKVPFDDLIVSLTSPGGVERRFWNRFQGEDVGGWLPDYTFTASWPMPTWWLTSVGGTWTLSVQDEEMHCLGPKPTNVSWCLTPLDPAIHASAPVDDPLSACASATGSIGDCDAESCPVTTVFEMQVSDIVRASGTPTLALSMSHENPSDLEIAFTCANGFEQTLWDRGSGTIPGSFDLTGMTGEWMTGRYQLLVRDNVIGDGGSVSSWCVNAN